MAVLNENGTQITESDSAAFHRLATTVGSPGNLRSEHNQRAHRQLRIAYRPAGPDASIGLRVRRQSRNPHIAVCIGDPPFRLGQG
jgi:hypothetical protein